MLYTKTWKFSSVYWRKFRFLRSVILDWHIIQHISICGAEWAFCRGENIHYWYTLMIAAVCLSLVQRSGSADCWPSLHLACMLHVPVDELRKAYRALLGGRCIAALIIDKQKILQAEDTDRIICSLTGRGINIFSRKNHPAKPEPDGVGLVIRFVYYDFRLLS